MAHTSPSGARLSPFSEPLFADGETDAGSSTVWARDARPGSGRRWTATQVTPQSLRLPVGVGPRGSGLLACFEAGAVLTLRRAVRPAAGRGAVSPHLHLPLGSLSWVYLDFSFHAGGL